MSVAAGAAQPQKFLVFDGHIQPAWIKAHANQYVFVWGASPDTVPTFQKFSPNTRLSTYFPHMRDPNPATTLAQWQAKHPTWVVYHCDGTTPVLPDNDKNITLDTNNPDVIQWQLERFEAGSISTKAVALDGLQLRNIFGVCGTRDTSGDFIRQYAGQQIDHKYADDVAAWITKVASALHEHGVRVVVNHIPDASSVSSHMSANINSPPAQRLVAAVDGMVEEGSNAILRSDDVALSVFKLADYVTSKHKWMYFIYEMHPLDAQSAESAMASYLIMASPSTAVFLSNGDETYGYAPDFFGYGRNIGTPCGAPSENRGLYTRTFSEGIAVFALAGSSVQTTAIPAGYQTVDGRPAPATTSIKPGEGMVLYRAGNAQCPH